MNCVTGTQVHEVDSISGDLRSFDPLAPVIHLICESMSVEQIYLIGTYATHPKMLGPEYDLLVLIRSLDKRPMHEYESLIENRCHDLAMVTATVHKVEVISQLLSQGNLFFSSLCDPVHLIYDSGYAGLIIRKDLKSRMNTLDLRGDFVKLMGRARSFLSGAAGYRTTGDFQLAAFMLHQTVEHTLNAFISPLIGYRVQTHNLNKLFLYARRISPDLYSIFPESSDREIRLYQTLHKAYIYGRYKNNFEVAEETVQALIERADILLKQVDAVFNQKLDELRIS